MDKKREMIAVKVVCPYCTKEISPGAATCRECGTTFGTDTLRIIRGHAATTVGSDEEERRKRDRVPKKFKISFPTLETLKDHYIGNIGTGGVFIQSKKPFPRGARFDLRIFLPDNADPLDVYCEVVWSQNEERVLADRKYSSGMGVKFLNLSVEGRNRIDKILETEEEQ